MCLIPNQVDFFLMWLKVFGNNFNGKFLFWVWHVEKHCAIFPIRSLCYSKSKTQCKPVVVKKNCGSEQSVSEFIENRSALTEKI